MSSSVHAISYGCVLLRESEISLAAPGNVHRLGLWFCPFMPGDDAVLAIGHVFDLVRSAGVGLREVGRRTDDDVARHLRVYVAQQRNHTGVIELERALVALGPGSEVVT